MDINHIKTYLAIVETGSFIDAADRIHVTQSTVSARVKSLEEQLGQILFHRSKSGATLTNSGEQFHKHAVALLRVWQHAQLDVSLAEDHTAHIAIGGQVSLWEGFLLSWLSQSRRDNPEIALTASMGHGVILMERLVEGTLDIAVMYRPVHRPGLVIEHLFDEELILVTSGNPEVERPGPDYIFLNWGPEFLADHAIAYKELQRPGLNLDLGSLAISYLLEQKASGYFPIRICSNYLKTGQLKLIKPAPKFVYPVYAVYSETSEEEFISPLLNGLRSVAATL